MKQNLTLLLGHIAYMRPIAMYVTGNVICVRALWTVQKRINRSSAGLGQSRVGLMNHMLDNGPGTPSREETFLRGT